MKIETIPIEQIHPYEQNAKAHPPDQVERIARSIEAFGFRQPVIMDADNEIVAGHGRLLAAEKLGLKKVPVIRIDDLTPEQIRAYRITDNKVAESEWMENVLAAEIQDMESQGLDLTVLGFTADEMAALKPPKNGKTDPDDVPDIPQDEPPTTQPGDLYLLGEHRVLCGDATKREDVERLMGGEKADMVFTDPPYGVSFVGLKGRMYSKGKKRGKDSAKQIENDDIRGGDIVRLYSESLKIAVESSKQDAPFYIFFAINRVVETLSAISEISLLVRNYLIWDKGDVGHHAMGAQYKPNFEAFLYCIQNKSPDFIGDVKQHTIWRHPVERLGLHSTMKPVSLVGQAIRNHPADVLLDPFLGSGTTLIACEKTGRTCYGMEIDPHYCDIIIKRWEDYTGEKAEKIT